MAHELIGRTDLWRFIRNFKKRLTRENRNKLFSLSSFHIMPNCSVDMVFGNDCKTNARSHWDVFGMSDKILCIAVLSLSALMGWNLEKNDTYRVILKKAPFGNFRTFLVSKEKKKITIESKGQRAKGYLWASFHDIWSLSKSSKLDTQQAISAKKIMI